MSFLSPLVHLRVELEDLKEVVHQVGVGEEEEEDDLDDGETDDEEGGRPLWDDATVSNDVECFYNSQVPEKRSVFFIHFRIR